MIFFLKLKNKHPSLEITKTYGTELLNKKVILCISGSVAAYKAIELARLLMRYGANVICVMSKTATQLIKSDYLKWATGNNVITKLTGELEHIQIADYKKSDFIVVYPATANIIGKLANGIDDTALSTILTVGFGAGIPIFISPAMHRSMYNNKAILNNIKFLEKKIYFILPHVNENKAKIVEPQEVITKILEKFNRTSILKNKNVLITAGSTIEYIDPIKIITNISTGKTGVLLARELIALGANVIIIHGNICEKPPENARSIYVHTTNEMLYAIKKTMKKKIDLVILSAAVSDYKPKTKSKIKISTKKEIIIKFYKTQKIIDQIKKLQSNVFLVGFKAEANSSKEKLIKKTKKRMITTKADMMIANDIGIKKYKKNSGYNDVIIISKKKIIHTGWKKKSNIAKIIIKNIEKNIQKN